MTIRLLGLNIYIGTIPTLNIHFSHKKMICLNHHYGITYFHRKIQNCGSLICYKFLQTQMQIQPVKLNQSFHDISDNFIKKFILSQDLLTISLEESPS
ncbi:hypothetical protein Hanom_Chr09g00806971 [Helianthus anomalus]